MMRSNKLPAVVLLALAAWASPAKAQSDPATPATRATFGQMAGQLDWTDRSDFADAERGLIGRYPEPQVRDQTGRVVWTFPDYETIRDTAAPDSVHPLLWRQQQLNSAHGLFRVTDRVYQLRGFDLANMTVIEGDTGLIVVDPLTSIESAKAALDLYYMHRPQRPVVAVIYTHSHMDHLGGVRGVVSGDDVTAGKVAIYAPQGFLEAAVSENVAAGNAMLRRTVYYSGIPLPRGPHGSLGAGLGAGVANGTRSFIAPTQEITGPTQTRTIDGITFEFQLANGTEAPSELMFFLPQFGVLDMAEVAVNSVHNVLTPRGAEVRDTGLWWQAIDGLLQNFGSLTDVLIGQHHWPTWGKPEVAKYLSDQRNLYKFIHDRSLHLANQGYTMDEIGEMLALPEALAGQWAVQDYYGTLRGAGKAVYQRYLGWYDGNPANLNRLPPGASAARYVSYMGGSAAILAKAQADFDRGEYRWVAEVLNRLIFAEPDNVAARELQARALTQLGYQQASASVRNVYLAAAQELRQGVGAIPAGAKTNEYIGQMPHRMLLDYAGVALSPERSAGKTLIVNLDFGGPSGTYRVAIEDGLLLYQPGAGPDAQAMVTLGNDAFDQLLGRRTSLAQAVQRGLVTVSGDTAQAEQFFDLFDTFSPAFPIVTP